MKWFQQGMALFLSWCLVGVCARDGFAYQNTPPPQAVQQSPDQLQQLVAPIALYPDALIAQILPAAAYPDQLVEAERWMHQHKDLSGDSLAKEVDKQAWDPGVKALAQFPGVLANMNQNLAWTSELGDAYINQQQELTQAIQTMRQRAKQAGNLQTTDQEKVSTRGQDIFIQPTSTEMMYVPQYDPWLVYGYPLAIFPGWYPYPGLFLGGPGIAFGLGFGVGFFGGFSWGWNHWGFDWHGGGRVIYNHNTYISHSRTIVNRSAFHSSRANSDHSAGFRIPADRGQCPAHIPARSADSVMAVLRQAIPPVGDTALGASTEAVLAAAFTAAEAGDRTQEAQEVMKMKREMMIPFVTLAISIGAGAGMAQPSALPAFPSAADAGQSLFQAVQDNNEASINKILGGSTDLTSSHDDSQDKADREVFVQKYQEMHRLHREPDGSVTLYIGAENWPFPIPIVEKNGAWRFDADAGQQEVRFRRIGENEFTAISVCHEFVSQKRDRTDAANPAALHGYYFRMLPPQKTNTAVGFAVVAYPAEYRSSGVMTFVLTEKSEVYEKDLGDNTAAPAGAMASFHKDATWSAAVR